ncbi:MAG TPA: protein kinase [Actinoplanes sp.]|nr:protein kinase [Actinoplanes sp.]
MIDVSTRIGGRYRVDSRLGGGGMADVYEAYDEVLDRPVAVKLLRGIDDAGAARRFAEEIRLTARVNHRNIVALYDAGEHDGSPFLVLERVTGGTLAGEMAAGPMEPTRVANMGEQLASALSHAHAAGIVHRDVKPTNILLTADGSVRLADFGIAVTATATRLTVTGTIAGSAGYVSPEQVLGSGAGAPSDVYALGLVLLECLTGAPPWSGTTVEVALARVSSDPYLPPDLPEAWRTLLRAMTARAPEQRPSIDLVGHALSKLAVDETFDPALFPAPAPAPDRRIPVVAALTLVVLMASAFMTLASNVRTDLAAAQSTSRFNVARAQAVLTPAANAPDQPLAEPAAARTDQARTRRQAATPSDRAAAPAREETATDARAAAPTQATTPEGTDAAQPNLDVAVPEPTLPRLGGSTSTNVPDLTDNETVQGTVDAVTRGTAQDRKKSKGKPDSKELPTGWTRGASIRVEDERLKLK